MKASPLTTSRKVLICLGCVAFSAVVIFVLCKKNSDPTFEGRTLSSWLTEYENDQNRNVMAAQHLPAANAVRQIGTNALPLMVNWMNYKVPKWYYELQPIARYIGMQKAYHEFTARDIRRHMRALQAFQLLGTNAIPAIPALVTLATNKNNEMASSALVALNNIGAPGKAALRSILKNPANPNRSAIVMVLSTDEAKNISISILLEYLNDSDPRVRQEATNGLWRIAPELLTNAPPRQP